MLPYIMLGDDKLFPLTVGLSGLLNQGASQPAMYTSVITGALLSILPLIALFLTLQRYWQVDLAAGAVKAEPARPARGAVTRSPAPRGTTRCTPVDLESGTWNPRWKHAPRASARPSATSRRPPGSPAGRCRGCINGGHWVSPEALDRRPGGHPHHRVLDEPARPVARDGPVQLDRLPAHRAPAPALRGPELLDPAARRRRGAGPARDAAAAHGRRHHAKSAAGSPTTSPPGHVDGVLLISSHRDNPHGRSPAARRDPGDRLRRADRLRGLRRVRLGRRRRRRPQDDAAPASTRAARRIATITGPLDTPGGTMRLAGYKRGARRPRSTSPRRATATTPARAAAPRWPSSSRPAPTSTPCSSPPTSWPPAR